MSTRRALDQAQSLLDGLEDEFTHPERNRLDARIPLASFHAAVEALHAAGWGYLAAITGLDLQWEGGSLEVLYHFCSGAAVTTLRVELEPDAPRVDSICDVIPSAEFFERELAEMFGIEVSGTPVPDRLFLPDDWPVGEYPLRKPPAAARPRGGK